MPETGSSGTVGGLGRKAQPYPEGWALWQLRGPFGVLDTERAGIRTEDCDGHRLDRTLFEMLKRHMP
jgi:hypothetical protein